MVVHPQVHDAKLYALDLHLITFSKIVDHPDYTQNLPKLRQVLESILAAMNSMYRREFNSALCS